MKLSIYRRADYSAKSKEDKQALSRLASSPNIPETIQVDNIDFLISAVTSYAWSPSVFDGVRSNDNFVSTDFMAVDVDNGLTIEEAEKTVQKSGLAALCLPSSSHTPEAHRFRLVFPLAKTIFSKKIFDDTWDYLLELFPTLDAACSDYCRFYIRSSMDDGFYQDGDFLLPVEKTAETEMKYNMSEVHLEVTDDIEKVVEELYGEKRTKIPESVHFFLKNAHTGIHGGWTNALNSAAFSLSLSGIDDTIIWEVCDRLCPDGGLDKKDKYQVTRAIRDGKNKRVKE
jgi:hypothetical protein